MKEKKIGYTYTIGLIFHIYYDFFKGANLTTSRCDELQ